MGHQGKPTVIDLFAGAGGLTAAPEQAGCRTMSAIDLDPLATAALTRACSGDRTWA